MAEHTVDPSVPPRSLPRWRGVVASILVLLIAALCVRLGFWQLDRHAEREAYNEELARSQSLPPLALRGDSLRTVLANPDAFLYRSVVLEGSYEPAGELVLRGRALGGTPGVNLITPVAPDGDSILVLVNRGWAPSDDAATVDRRLYTEPGPQQILGLLLPLGSEGNMQEATISVGGSQSRTVRRVDHRAISAEARRPVLPLLVQQLPDGSPGVPLTRLPPPEIDGGPHLGYAVQWFSFAAVALGGLAVMLHLSRKRG